MCQKETLQEPSLRFICNLGSCSFLAEKTENKQSFSSIKNFNEEPISTKVQSLDITKWGRSQPIFCQCMNTLVLQCFSPDPSPSFPFISQGEICLCTSRIYVERSIYPEFLERFVAAAKKWKTGDPSDTNNNNGALISKEHLEKVIKVSNATKEQFNI